MQLHKNLEEKNRLREESRLKGRKYKGKDSTSDSNTAFQTFLPSKDESKTFYIVQKSIKRRFITIPFGVENNEE